jgi:diguanylate cyclase (GGDEF)-like protein/PAS domain S-box-containing protein
MPSPLVPGAPVSLEASALAALLAAEALHSVFQPIIDLDTGEVVAYEALVRGPEGPLSGPAALFATARKVGMLAELDGACRAAAFRGAARSGVVAPLTLFVNVEPEVLDAAPLDELLALADGVPGELRIVLEITERALAARPAELLRTVARVRNLGWGVALDDVGVESASLAFMSLLRPDVVKLDLSLVQERPSPVIAEIMNAVNAYAERSGALLLAEGIETEQHLATAMALGATLGQGWLYGRPSADPQPQAPSNALELLAGLQTVDEPMLVSPFAALPAGARLRRSPKRLLVELSKQLEREAMRLGDTCVVAATFQHGRHFTPSSAQRYRDLVERTGFVCALGEDLPDEPVPGLRGAALAEGDPLLGEWDIVVLSPHFSAALLARDLGDAGPDADRTFEYALTYDRDAVTRAAHGLLSRVAPRQPETARGLPSSPAPVDGPPTRSAQVTAAPATAVVSGRVDEALMMRALSVTTSGVTVVDMLAPDQPLIFVNAAFERLSGRGASELLGRNCRVLQGPDTDREALRRMRTAVEAGQDCRETILNYRGPDREVWWNEIHLSPVRDASGRVVQYLGVQHDVTARVSAERALARESDLARTYLTRIEQLAFTDALTGLMNRRRFEERLESELLEARVRESALAVLFLDLDGFKAVNDTYGHVTGDELLVEVTRRLQRRLRSSDLLARFGGDEFVVALTDLAPAQAASEAKSVAAQLAAAVNRPFGLPGRNAGAQVSVSVGISVWPHDAEDIGSLLHLADLRMFEGKHPGVNR